MYNLLSRCLSAKLVTRVQGAATTVQDVGCGQTDEVARLPVCDSNRKSPGHVTAEITRVQDVV